MKALRKDDPCWCNSGKKYCDCHMEFDRKLDNFKRKFHKVPPRNIIKNEEQLAGMRESSKINIAVLDYVAENIHAGMTTQDIDDLVYQNHLITKDFQRVCVLQLMSRYVMEYHLRISSFLMVI